MNDSRTLLATMAAKCRDVIRGSNEEASDLPLALHPQHILWMCDQIESNPQEWPVAKLHRWIGFIQAAILANRMLDIEQIREMFDTVAKTHGATTGEQDLIDHLDVENSFQLDVGGQG